MIVGKCIGIHVYEVVPFVIGCDELARNVAPLGRVQILWLEILDVVSW